MINTKQGKILSLLRIATLELHKTLDENLPMSSPNPSIEDYSQHLLWFSQWLSWIEKVVFNSLEPEDEFSAENALTLSLLEQDLNALNIKTFGEASFNADFNMQGVAYRLGVEYVVKGAALGTSLLCEKVSQLHPQVSIEFMKDAAKNGKARWKKFLVKLESFTWSDEDVLSAQQGARWAFKQYIYLHNQSITHNE